MSCWIAATAIARDPARIAAEAPELWRDVRRFNLPVKLALAAAHRVVGALARSSHARLVGLAPCRPGSPELRALSRELDAGFAQGSCDRLRVNPIYTLHALDNLALSALAIRIENRAPCVCLGGAAGQAFAALEDAIDEFAVGPGGAAPDDMLIFGGDQSDAAWQGVPGEQACGVAVAVTARPGRIRLVAVERTTEPDGDAPEPHAVAGLARWLDALAAAPSGVHRYAVPGRDGDGGDRIVIAAEVA